MRKRRSYIFPAALLIVVPVVVAFAVGCGSSSSGGNGTASSPSASSTGTGLSGTALQRAETILGHAPTGRAKTIVDRGSVIVCTDANYPPQSSIDEATGELVGFDVDTAKGMGELLGLTIDFKTTAWETIPANLQQGRFDVSIGSMTPTPERRKALAFTEPYYYVSAQVLCRKGGPQITGIESLFGTKVGVCAATTYYTLLKKYPKIDVKTYATDADTFPDLRNGNLDFVLTAGPTGQAAISSGQPFEFSGQPLSYDDCCFALKLDEPDWLTLLDYSVKEMHANGSLTAMSKQWYNGLDLTVK